MTHWWRRIGNRVAADNYHACYYDMVPPTRGPPAGSGLPTGPGGQGPRRLEAEERLRRPFRCLPTLVDVTAFGRLGIELPTTPPGLRAITSDGTPTSKAAAKKRLLAFRKGRSATLCRAEKQIRTLQT